MDLVRTVPALRARVAAWQGKGAGVALVPGMGGLHEGYLSLLRAARADGLRPVAAIFAEPPEGVAQAFPAEPALGALDAAGAALAFLPGLADVYPPGFATRVTVGRFADMLCALNRPGHFDGVARLMAKFINMAGADAAYFGEKDWQQLQVIRALVRDLDIPTRIVGCPTMREADGLALSARNRLLSADQRRIAPRIFAEITEAADRISRGEPTELACAEAQENLIIAGFPKVEYLECRDAETLRIAPAPGRGARVFAAAQLGGARLIDNVAVPLRPGPG